MTRLYAYLIAGVILVIGGGGLWLWGREGHQKAASEAVKAQAIATQLDTANEALRAAKRAREIEAGRVAVAQRRLAEVQAANKELRDALEDHPGWAAEPVPDSVWRAIEGAPGGAGAQAEPGPAR